MNRQSKRNPKGNKNFRRNCKKEVSTEKPAEFDKNKTTNDPMWYAMTPELLRDAGKIPFSWSVGTPFRTTNALTNNQSVPGIMSITLAPAYGWADSATDPLNIAAFELYSYVRHANSGSANYDAPDLMLYILAVSNACSYIEFLRRVYGVANVYSQRNRYLPKGLIESMRVDFDDVLKHMADFRYGVNVLINKLASFAAPSELTLFKRQAFLFSQVYTEGTSVKDQLYLYNPAGFGRFMLTGSKFSDAPAGALGFVPFDPGVLNTIVIDQNNTPVTNGKNFTVDDLLNYGRMLMQPLLESEDLNIMSGDILKAYGADRIFKFAFIDENYMIAPIFDIGVLEQIKNLKFYNTALFNGNNKGDHVEVWSPFYRGIYADSDVKWWPLLVYQDLSSQNYGNLHSEWGFNSQPGTSVGTTRYENALGEKFITTTTAEVTPELVMESTRLVASLVPDMMADINSNNEFYPYYCGTEVVTEVAVFQHVYDPAKGTLTLKKTARLDGTDRFVGQSEGTSTYESAITALSTLRYFDFAPEVAVLKPAATGAGLGTCLGLCFDLDNYAVLSTRDVARLHEAAILSELHVSSIARI